MKKVGLYVLAMTSSLLACSPSAKQDVASEEQTCQKVEEKTLPQFDNTMFYTAEGAFNEEAAKDAVLQLMEYYHYPITEKTRASIWVSDYGTGNYAKLGLACIGYANDLDAGYMLQDLFLLPGQMLPEHWHEKIGKYPAKMEGWLVRNGKSYIVGIGEDNLSSFPEIKVPACHQNGTVTVKHVVPAESGEFVPLTEVLSHHWQFAGDQGAIISEVANGHENEAVRHLDPKINDHFLGK